MPITISQAVPPFELAATSGFTFSMAKMIGHPVVIYFYPKDNTPGCTVEAGNFRDQYHEFSALGAALVGISRDNLKSHENFKKKLMLPFELLADTEEIACTLFDVIKLKKMYGKEVRGIERSTFLIDRHGILQRAWRGVKVPGHVNEVLEALRALTVDTSSDTSKT